MIFFAVASPTPGNSFSSAALALFKSTVAPDALDTFDALVVVALADLLALELGVAVLASPNVTRGEIFLMVAAETPAFDKSLAEE
jgi:hypothetical protein